MLNSLSITLSIPSEPAFFIRSKIDPDMPLDEKCSSSTGDNDLEKNRSKSSQISVNYVSVSENVPR